ncbi:MAG: nucleotide exchange factor GrpE [Candidatus Portnoybacteria bacterium CG10_big_fil_rev_8_21_14_0_10_36_7]|uniref:Protein GrpE n=1 Tax=Candidatus Portnoybacteria bacterium CG10_big_fil_rev_8_21_14_0_10_36_7 TaxID=1974812 RepID=A0A2M8KEX3_9BACT|nr:MAG: nucleotide exchange factor GrpE [Candidatus Portnoybacteria bacterium CG10_big_fil_rev_8_21_14_0_10_36_7]
MEDEILKNEVVPEEEIEIEPEENEEIDIDDDKKVKKIKEKLNICQEEKAKYLDSWQRVQADFINYRKMQEERNAEFVKYSKQEILRELLPLMDAFEAAVGHFKETEGLKMMLVKILKENGVEVIETLGKQFDPHIHEAIKHIESDKPDEEIVEEVQKGYNLNGKILRIAIVKVSKQKK